MDRLDVVVLSALLSVGAAFNVIGITLAIFMGTYAPLFGVLVVDFVLTCLAGGIWLGHRFADRAKMDKI